jgi:hypothetical protein
MSAERRMGPAFEPWERFMLLDLMCEEVPADRAAEVLPIITRTAMVIVRQVQGRVTHAEADAHLARARDLIMSTRRRP